MSNKQDLEKSLKRRLWAIEFLLLLVVGLCIAGGWLWHQNNQLTVRLSEKSVRHDKLRVRYNELQTNCRADRRAHFVVVVKDPEWIMWEIAWIEAELKHADALTAARKKQLRQRKKILSQQRQKPLLQMNAKQRIQHLQEDIRRRRRRIKKLRKQYD